MPPTGFSETEDYLFSGMWFAPLDIQIQALLYAQERSFFVIPGYSFNQSPNDTRTNFALSSARPIYVPWRRRPFEPKHCSHFYNDPLDVKITIDGAITENYTASAGDQAAWMAKWGYIPTEYRLHQPTYSGSTPWRADAKEIADHIARGLTFT